MQSSFRSFPIRSMPQPNARVVFAPLARPSLWPRVALVAATLFAASCDRLPTHPDYEIPEAPFVDAESGGHPDFFWVPPTVATAPDATGPFDATALDELRVEIHQLDPKTMDHTLVETFTSTSSFEPSRIRLNEVDESYKTRWQPGPSQVSSGDFYAAVVFRGDERMGSVAIQIVRNRFQLRFVDTSMFLGLIRGTTLELHFRVQGSPAMGEVVINEVESNGDDTDWVEFYNVGDAPIDLSGYGLKDDNDTRDFTIAEGTVLAPGAFLVLDDGAFDFGLGGADEVRLYAPDGTTLVASYAWPAHAPTTYGRCPDGTGDFQVTTLSTRGAPNLCLPDVRINEIESSGGEPGDWVELYNYGTEPVDLSGYGFKDSDDSRTFTISAGTVLAPGAFLVIDEAEFDFGLGGGDSARLFAADGTTVVDEYSWDAHAATTYGRCPDGIGPFATTLASTRGAANACAGPVTTVVVNEVESSGGDPGDWVEFYNAGSETVDLSGYLFRDNNATHAFYPMPAGTELAPGAFLVIDETQFGFGLGSGDAAQLFAPDGVTVVASHAWSSHAVTSYGRCPDGTGDFFTTTTVTKGAPNDCTVGVVINEVESSGGEPGDWVEFYNPSPLPVDLAGYTFRDGNDSNGYLLPAGTTVPGTGYLVLDEADFGFGLGGGDAARLFTPGGDLLDGYSWTEHASVTYGRCPDATGAFTTTATATKGSVNICPGDIPVQSWPGSAAVATVDAGDVFGGDMSGLAYQPSGSSAPGVLWGSRNGGPGAVFRLVWDGSNWTPDTAGGWGAGKPALYMDGSGEADAEGITVVGSAIYLATERDNANSGVSRNSILRYDASAAGASLVATHEWNITADLPPNTANTGLEAIAFVPDAFLVSSGFIDASTGAAYDPLDYPDHAGGLFFVGVEATGAIYAYALNHTDGSFDQIAEIASGFDGVMGLEFDAESGTLWAACDDGCGGEVALFDIDTAVGSPTLGQFVITTVHARPAGMDNLNNEGIALGATAECVGGERPFYWADDGETGGHALRRGSVGC